MCSILNGQYNIRQAILTDSEEIFRIWNNGISELIHSELQINHDDYEKSKDYIVKIIAEQTKNFKLWVCLNKSSKICAWCSILPFIPSPNHNLRNAIGIMSLYVSKSNRFQGIGSELMKFTINYCKSTKLSYVMGLITHDNYLSIKISEKNGFKRIGSLQKKGIIPKLEIHAVET